MIKEKNIPTWYWNERGLHDALVVDCDTYEIDGENIAELKFDMTGALGEVDIKKIILIGYECYDIEQIKGAWWLYDELETDNDKFMLSIVFGKKDFEFKLKIKFEDAKVER